MRQILVPIFMSLSLWGYSQNISSVNDSTITTFMNQVLDSEVNYPGTKPNKKKRVLTQPIPWINATWDLGQTDLNDSVFQEKFYFVLDTLKKYFNTSDMSFLEEQFKNQVSKKWVEYELRAKFNDTYTNNFFEYSIPLFSTDNQSAIIYEYYYCGNLCAYSGLWLYRRIDGQWKKYKLLKGWIS